MPYKFTCPRCGHNYLMVVNEDAVVEKRILEIDDDLTPTVSTNCDVINGDVFWYGCDACGYSGVDWDNLDALVGEGVLEKEEAGLSYKFHCSHCGNTQLEYVQLDCVAESKVQHISKDKEVKLAPANVTGANDVFYRCDRCGRGEGGANTPLWLTIDDVLKDNSLIPVNN